MAEFLRLSANTIINLDLVTDVQFETETKGQFLLRKLTIALSAPEPAGVGGHDWSVRARRIVLQDDEAQRAWNWFCAWRAKSSPVSLPQTYGNES